MVLIALIFQLQSGGSVSASPDARAVQRLRKTENKEENGVRQLSLLVSSSTASWGMRGAGDPRMQRPSGFARLPSCSAGFACRAACAPGEEKIRLICHTYLVYSLPQPCWGERRDVSTRCRRGGKPRALVENRLHKLRGCSEAFAAVTVGIQPVLRVQVVGEVTDSHENPL